MKYLLLITTTVLGFTLALRAGEGHGHGHSHEHITIPATLPEVRAEITASADHVRKGVREGREKVCDSL